MRDRRLEYTRADALARIEEEVLRAHLLEQTQRTQLNRVRLLLDDRVVARLIQKERSRVEELVGELKALLTGQRPKKPKRS